MIKFFGLIPRRQDISVEEFHDHWRHPHGTLVTRTSTLRGYVQSHQIQSEHLGPDQTRFEGVAEAWFDDVGSAVGLADHPHYVEHTKKDEPNFVDLERLQWLYATEDVLIAGPDPREAGPLAGRLLDGLHVDRPIAVKLLHFAPDAVPSADGDRVARGLGAVRYVRCRAHAEIHAGDAPAFAEVHELWWPTVWAFRRAAADADDALRALIERDAGSITLLATAERFI